MPPGDAWQLLGRSIGANPNAAGLCRDLHRLQTGAVDGQDNPLPNVQAVKFYEGHVADRADVAPRRDSTCSPST
jgi:TRAP-type C4-dicarboxylate transport system substrate-binding protein